MSVVWRSSRSGCLTTTGDVGVVDGLLALKRGRDAVGGDDDREVARVRFILGDGWRQNSILHGIARKESAEDAKVLAAPRGALELTRKECARRGAKFFKVAAFAFTLPPDGAKHAGRLSVSSSQTIRGGRVTRWCISPTKAIRACSASCSEQVQVQAHLAKEPYLHLVDEEHERTIGALSVGARHGLKPLWQA